MQTYIFLLPLKFIVSFFKFMDPFPVSKLSSHSLGFQLIIRLLVEKLMGVFQYGAV